MNPLKFLPLLCCLFYVSKSKAQCSPRPLPFSETFSGVTLNASCSWSITSAPSNHGGWSINNTNYAGGSSPEVEAWGNQACGGCVETMSLTLASPLNTTGALMMQVSFRHTVYVHNGASSGSGGTLRLQTSADGSTWTDRWTKTYTVTTSGSSLVQSTAGSVSTATFNPNSNTTYIRFAITGTLYKVWGWEIDNVTTNLLDALPIELSYLAAVAEGRGIRLEWTTQSEINNAGFTIERSADGLGFDPIDQVKGGGSSTQPLHYTVLDEAPLPGINYYRLKQTDTDGHYRYSHMVSASLEDPSPALQLYPNPGNNILYLNWPAQQGTACIELTDPSGRILLRNETAGNATELGTGELPAGLYFVRLTTGTRTQVLRWIRL